MDEESGLFTPIERTEKVAKDGPTALGELKDVQNMLCVAFGAFDRYYMAWQENSGELHQGEILFPSLYQSINLIFDLR